MEIPLLYQDSNLVIINKPAGVVVNKCQTAPGTTIQEWFSNYLHCAQSPPTANQDWEALVPTDFDDQYGTPEEIFQRRDGLVHRLDKETSGVLLLATNPGSLVHLLRQFKQRQVQKKYQCLVHGRPQVDSARIDAPIARSQRQRHKFWVDIEGKSATTVYKVQRHFPRLSWDRLKPHLSAKEHSRLEEHWHSYQQGFSLVECWPKTGRTHQIRVHMKHIGHPLVADDTYGGNTRSKLDRSWCPRQFLHASWIQFTHPQSEQKVTATAPLAGDLQRALGWLS
jgi:23S rRNA pseudouridine1911/1915/1917 synthase